MTTNYIYFVNLEDFLVCHNLGVTNTISTSAIEHLGENKELHPVYTLPVEELRHCNLIGTFTSPRLSFITMSNMLDNGMILGMGIENTKFFSEAETKRIKEIGDIELEFERVRRLINPLLPSRLVSIYLANDDFDGKTMLKNMFPNKKDFLIVSVNINICLFFHKADSQWFDNYLETKNVTAIENYWKGIDFNSIPLYEYLVDGSIKLNNESDKIMIFEEYKKRHKSKASH